MLQYKWIQNKNFKNRVANLYAIGSKSKDLWQLF